MVLSAHQSKIFKEGCKKEVLMQYKCMEKEIRKLHGRILYPICHVDREYSGRNAALTERTPWIPVQAPDFSPRFSRENRNEFCRFVKSKTIKQKHGYHPLQHEPAFPDDKSRVDAGFSYGLALPPDSERPAILSGTDLYPCFCAVFFITKKPGASPRPMISEFCMISSKRSIGLASRFRPWKRGCEKI